MKPEHQRKNLLDLAYKLFQLWKNPKIGRPLKIGISILGFFYAIGMLPETSPWQPPIDKVQVKTEPTPTASPIETKFGDVFCSNIHIGSGDMKDTNACSSSGASSGTTVFRSETKLSNPNKNSSDSNGKSPDSSRSASDSSSKLVYGNFNYPQSSKNGQYSTVLNHVQQNNGNTLLPIAIGFYRTKKVSYQIGEGIYTGAYTVGSTIVKGVEKVERSLSQRSEPPYPDTNNKAPQSCSFR